MGYIALEIARLNPGMHVVLQDTNEVIEQGKEFWKRNAPEMLEQGRVKFVPFDFFKEPPIAGCDYYYVSRESISDMRTLHQSS